MIIPEPVLMFLVVIQEGETPYIENIIHSAKGTDTIHNNINISHFQAFQGIHQPSQLSGCKYLPCHLSACLFLHNIQEFL